MPYFKNNDVNILFIHIPKTGGTSLEIYFSKKFNIQLDNKSLYLFLNKTSDIKIDSSLQHMTFSTIIKYKEYFNIDFTGLKILTIVRNPYERIISDLFFNKHWTGITPASTKNEVFDIIQKYLSSTDCDNHNLPQYLYITTEDKELLPEIEIMRTETLTEDMHRLGFTDFDIKENCNKHTLNYYTFLNNNSIKLINETYSEDFRLFGYTKIETD